MTVKTILTYGFTALMGVCCLFWFSCSRDEPFMKPDKVEEADSLEENQIDTPDIFIQEKVFSSSSDIRYFTTDTVLTTNDVIISTPNAYESYRWKVGSDPDIREKQKFSIWFDFTTRVKVRLIGTKQNGNKDTFSRHLTVLNHPVVDTLHYTTPLIDTFKGSLKSNPDHQFKVYFGKEKPFGSNTKSLFFYNLPEGCKNDKWGIDIRHYNIGYRSVALSTSMTGCKGIYGFGRLKNNGQKLRVEYRTDDKDHNVFVGHKIN